VRRLAALVTLLVLATACSGPLEPPEGFAFAYARQGCTPVDGEALWLFLTGTSTNDPASALPRVYIAINRPLEQVTEQTWVFGRDGDIGSASRCYTQQHCVSAVISRVTVRRFEADSTVVGEATLRFGDGSTVNGRIRATWIPTRILCG
jgi:hypothetical protein